jgi:N-formylglutamate deformylase
MSDSTSPTVETADAPCTLHRGTAPLLVSLPHMGTWIPQQLLDRMHPRAAETEDTDWHLGRLYAFARELGASVLMPRASRYVVDLNRPPENTPMYPGVNNTGLCPLNFFTGEPLYRPGAEPDEAEIRQRVADWWVPYHDALKGELLRLKARHGHVVLFDGHSIKSELPWLFDGRLWDLNLGTASGGSCDSELRAAVVDLFEGQSRFSHVADGRFRGGYITRHYGRPGQGVHALQLEMCWRCYMDETPPYAWNAARAAEVQPLLRALLTLLRDWRPQA